MRNFGIGILAGFVGTFGGLFGLFFAVLLFAPDRVPPPAITPIAQIDQKLQFIRDNPQIDPRIVAVGSSITYRQLAGDEFSDIAGGRQHFLNGGVVHLQVDQTRQFADFYLDNYPNIETVLMLTSIPDFEDCSSEREPMLDPDSARGFSFDRYPSVFYYLKYFSPQRYVRGAMGRAERQTPFYGDLYIDEYGSGPMKARKGQSLGLRYGAFEIDPTCIDAMERFATDMARRGVQLAIVFAPIHPEYRAKLPQTMTEFERAIAEIKERVADEKTFLLDLHASAQFKPQDYYDAFHLVWSGTQALSDIIATNLERLHADNATAARRSPADKPQSEKAR